MTLPDERANALIEAKHLLWGLAFELKKIPRDVRDRAKSILRHYPWECDIEQIANCCPEQIQMPLSKVQNER